MIKDTIGSIATAISPSGIGIIRLSGPDAIEIADLIFVSKKKDKFLKDALSHTIHYGHIVLPDSKEIVDEVLISIMRGPHSYTKEDVIEINCHGGVIVVEHILKLVISLGVRLAEPGEFTKRAFLNGRIDLAQAEAVIDVINAKTQLSLKSSMGQLQGRLSDKIETIRKELIILLAHIEASIDYPEYEIESLALGSVEETLRSIEKKISNLISTYDNGKLIREGIKTAIIGKPNVGKSSLLNALLKEQRAIVTDVAGTTRDVLEEYMNIHGIPIRLMDTAGIRDTIDKVEKIGVERSKNKLEEADLIIFVLDASRVLDDEDLMIMEMVKNKEIIYLLNKVDLDEQIDRDSLKRYIGNLPCIEVSAIKNEGIDELESKIKEVFLIGNIDTNEQVYVTNVRHRDALEQALKSLDEVNASISDGMPEDCWSIDLKNVYDYIGVVTGDSITEDLVDQIFSQFCLGK